MQEPNITSEQTGFSEEHHREMKTAIDAGRYLAQPADVQYGVFDPNHGNRILVDNSPQSNRPRFEMMGDGVSPLRFIANGEVVREYVRESVEKWLERRFELLLVSSPEDLANTEIWIMRAYLEGWKDRHEQS